MFGIESIHDRTTSGFPVSISTGLALESIFSPRQAVYDPDRVTPPRVDLSKYQEFWVNTATLFRNMVSASSREIVLNHNVHEIVSVIEQEMEVIRSLFSHEGNNECKPRFYTVDYKHALRGQHHSIKYREDTTLEQRAISARLMIVDNLLTRNTDEILEFHPNINPPQKVNAFILTHQPYDLLSHKHFHRLDLLESNTGKIKTKHQWNSKYYPVGKADMSHLPFLKTLLFILGDRYLIHQNIFKLREIIMSTSVKRNWTPMTTREKVMFDLELEIKEPYVLQVLRSIH